MCRAKRSGNTMIVSSASEPQISVRGPAPAFVTPRRRAPLAGIFAADLANNELLAPRDRQGLVDAAQQDFPMSVAFSAHVSLKSAVCLARNKAVAVHTNKALPNSSSSLVSDSSSRYSRSAV